MVEKDTDSEMISLPPVLDITTVQIWHENLINHCYNRDSLTIDASLVKRITSPGIQLLVSFYKKFEENKKQLLVDNYSYDIQEALGDLGLVDLLKKWSKET